MDRHTYNFIHVHSFVSDSLPANVLVTFELTCTCIFSCEGVEGLSVLVHKIGEPWDEIYNVMCSCIYSSPQKGSHYAGGVLHVYSGTV